MDNSIRNVDTKLVSKLFFFDTILGYRWGFFLWFMLWCSNFMVLILDDDIGPPRDYAGTCGLISSLSLIYYCIHHWAGTPSIVPAQHAIMAEVFARLQLAAYLGFGNVIASDNMLGGWNLFQIIFTSIFLLPKLVSKVYINFNYSKYKAYERELHGYQY